MVRTHFICFHIQSLRTRDVLSLGFSGLGVWQEEKLELVFDVNLSFFFWYVCRYARHKYLPVPIILLCTYL